MYTNPSNIVKTYIRLLERNRETIDSVVQIYNSTGSRITLLEGVRQSLPASAFPCLEIESGSASNEWATTRGQRPRFSFTCMLTAMVNNQDLAEEYITTLATVVVEIMTDPQNLQLRVVNESRWDANNGLVATYIMDSLVESVTFNSAKSGTIRVAEFDLFAEVHEPYPDSHFPLYATDDPDVTVVRPREVVLPE